MATDGRTGKAGSPRPTDTEVRRARRSWPASYKLAVLAEIDAAQRSEIGEIMRREGLYSSLISEWRRQRDRGALEGLSAKKGRPPVDARDREIARLTAERDRLAGELARTRRVVEVQGKLSALLEDLSAESANNDTGRRR